jgi:tRNA pseudouridine55 synthase
LNGFVLPIDKPAGWTSFDVVAKLRGGLKWKKVGHAGTLDPAATGLLLVVFGDCTTSADEFQGLGKRYIGVVKLGVTTDSDDLDGEITSESDVRWDCAEIRRIVESFRGMIMQTPPAVSAIKVNGKRSYKRARKGEAVELAPRPVSIDEIRILELNNPFVTLDIRCSKGTYIRSIARDLGRELGCGGALASLRRTEIGSYHVDDAWSIDDALMHPEFRGQ